MGVKSTPLETLGEFGLIRRFAKTLREKLPEGVVGIGDDCAVLPGGLPGGRARSRSLLVTTDMLIEGTHFILGSPRRIGDPRTAGRGPLGISPFDLGYKSLAVSLSDIAAMGGTPRSAFLSLSLTNQIDIGWVDQFFKGWRQLARCAKLTLLGGDTTKSLAQVAINVTVLGDVAPSHTKLRSMARTGDVICVTGFLGDSGAGLKLILGDRTASIHRSPTANAGDLHRSPGARIFRRRPLRSADRASLLRRHLRPRPHIEEGQWLGRRAAVHALMDVSDGIDSDLRRIMERSRCGAAIDLDALPLSPALQRSSPIMGWDATVLAATAGEDYCLLTTVDPSEFQALALAHRRRFKRPLYAIGRVTGNSGRLIYHRFGKQVRLSLRGYDQFR